MKTIKLGNKWQQYSASIEKWIRELRLDVKRNKISQSQEIGALLYAADRLINNRGMWENMPVREWWKLGKIARRLGVIAKSIL